MCAYKIVRVRFEVWGFQTRVEDFTQRVGLNNLMSYRNSFAFLFIKAVRDILILAHRQAFTWMDEW